MDYIFIFLAHTINVKPFTFIERMSPMKSPRTIGEILSQTKKIEENNWDSTQYLNSINMLLTSNDLGKVKDEKLSQKFTKLNDKMEDVNKLTEDLLSHLSSKHN